jgi:N-acetylmuramoyl-L-alanine amidase
VAVPSVILQGDYVSTHDRQKMAVTHGCICVVDFHFNSFANTTAQGGSVIYQLGNPISKAFADVTWAEIAAIGLPPHGSPVQSTTQAPRGAYITSYIMPTILLEPLFISSPPQATWLHNASNFNHLADAISAAILGQFLGFGPIGLSPGHAFKSKPDPGAP